MQKLILNIANKYNKKNKLNRIKKYHRLELNKKYAIQKSILFNNYYINLV